MANQSEKLSKEAAENLSKLTEKLRELFQLDRGDLDFGLYRIMALKSAEVDAFLANDLLPQVSEALGDIAESDISRLEKEIETATKAARELDVDPEQTPKMKELRNQINAAKKDRQIEADTYNHLYNFFARYYDQGDFMSQRRYKGAGKEAYSIPYNGEEVKLHWANADQYYVKTTENYASYIFTVDDGKQKRRVRFEIAGADNEKDNIKEAKGKQRFFVLSKKFITVEKNDLVIRFDHRPLTDGEKARHPQKGARKQESINGEAEKRILAQTKKLNGKWFYRLAASSPPPPPPPRAKGNEQKDSIRTVLGKHITAYTAKNSFDYFIHKDLGAFLHRELDTWLKSEVISIANLTLEDDSGIFRRNLNQVKAIKKVGSKIIDFLAQLEDFQKQLWLKKKFVLETQYCVTLDKVPESLYATIARNRKQVDEWVKLFAIDELKGDLVETPYSKPLKPTFLKENPYLVVDTRHFDEKFTDKLLTALSETGPIEEHMNGLLVHGENFQALNLMQERYRDRVQCVYIDPPFNTQDGDFAYKDHYPSSSWLSAMSDRFDLAKNMMSESAQMAVHIDENEQENLGRLLSICFGTDNNFGPMIWNKRNPKGDAKGLATQHETIFWAVKNRDVFTNQEGNLSRPKKNADKILDMASKLIERHKSLDTAREQFKAWIANQRHFSGGELAYKKIDENGDVFRVVSMAWPNKKKAAEEYFIPLRHPVTQKICPVPLRGWRNPPDTMQKLLSRGEIIFGDDEKTQPGRKYLLRNNLSENVSSVFEYGGSSDNEAKALGLYFETMKPLVVAEYICHINRPDGLLLDYFAGSGTTGHAVTNLNREDGGNRKYILVEIGDHFEDVLLPRMKKVTYSRQWEDGKPKDREGISQLFKYIRLESYEDTLDSLTVNPRNDLVSKAKHKEFVEDYQLRYALGEETAESASLVGEDFIDPFNYTLSVVRDGVRRAVKADLAETFNYLLGLRLISRRQLEGVLTITGTTTNGDNCLVLWRNMQKTDASKLGKWFTKHRRAFGDDLHLIYVNGDHTLNALKQSKDKWEAITTEPVFRELMFGYVD